MRWAQAREHHTLACRREASQPPDYNGALAEYQRAYALYEAHPERYRFQGNIGRCHQALGQYDAAIEALQRYLAEAPPDATGRARVEGMISALETTLAVVDITANVPGARVILDDREVGTAPGRVRVPVGRHVLELRAHGHAPSRQEVQVSAGETATLRFTLEALGRRGISPVFFWSGVGVTAAALTAGAVCGVLALDARGDVDARLASTNPRVRFSVTEDDGDRVADLSLAADVFFAGAALFGVGSTVLFFLTEFRRAPEGASSARAWRVAPTLSPTQRGVQLMVGF